MYSGENHTFAICAYKESKYLEECIQSVKNQSVQSNIIISTSTPNDYICGLAKKYGITLYINEGKGGIAEDWNYAYSKSKTKLVTLAHQDDIYEAEYTKEIIGCLNKSKHPLIAFSDYCELRKEVIVRKNKLLMVKRILLSPLRCKALWKSIWVRRRILSFGSAICCPTVTMVKENLSNQIFYVGMKSNIDWEAWEKISKEKGSFVYCCKPLIRHRIHAESTTTDIIKNGERQLEDLEMFRKFWPGWFAVIWEKLYSHGEKSNGF